jgi:phospholipase C
MAQKRIQLAWFLLCLASSAAAGCASENAAPAGVNLVDGGPVYNANALGRARCDYGPDAGTELTLGHEAPDAHQIKNVIVAVLENRSFDNLLSGLGAKAEVAHNETNPDGLGHDIRRYPAEGGCTNPDPRHEWSDAHLAFAGGRMDGFVAASGCHAMSYYTEEQLPVLYRLANTFAINDHYFSSVMGPTWPNWMFLFAATSCSRAQNTDVRLTMCGEDVPNIFRALERKHISYGIYHESNLFSVGVLIGVYPLAKVQDSVDFAAAANAGTLPEVSIVGASTGEAVPLTPPENDDHAPSNVFAGDQFLLRLVRTVTNSPQWESTALFITFDENGGFYDHVPPPKACDPATDDGDQRSDYQFDRYGFRVPLVLISPYARTHYVSSLPADHTSITRFIEHWKGLGAFTKRDANAWPLLDMFDFEHPPDTTKPDLPDASVPPACDATQEVICPQ